VKLTDRYTEETGLHYLTGIQALVRLPMDQMRLDRRAGLRTAAYITGYEGSPLGGYDLALARAGGLLRELDIHFQPAVNEDLAATAVLGTQIFQVAGDAFRHANLAGCAGINAALVLAGDDHACKSSSIPHQSDFALMSAGIPILAPGNSQEILDYGLYAIAMSRHSGAWVSLKLLTNVCDGGGTVDVSLDRRRFHLPEGYVKYTSGMLVPTVANGLEVEAHVRRMEQVRAFRRLNPLDRMRGARSGARWGIAASGKTFYDVLQALRDLGVDAAGEGIRLAQYAMTWPVSEEFTREFADGLEEILVIEEKRAFLETQIKDTLYHFDRRPKVTGKPEVPLTGELDPDRIARIVARRLTAAPGRIAVLDAIEARTPVAGTERAPSYCPGCPHNRSTQLPEGRIAGGGIGCHGMGMLMGEVHRGYEFAAQMGSEGVPWIGMAPFTGRKHIFQNMGDGTLFHSGYLAIEAAVAAGVSITYRILYNGHVAMTGGQDAVGALGVPELTRKLEAEGVKRTLVLAEDVERYSGAALAANAELRGRDELERSLRELERTAGVTVLIFDQECAAEKRRKRARGIYAEPVKRLAIHPRVCEGCGDCVRASNCMSLLPVKTPYGERMTIHQASCNKDYSCALGDCPSFVTLYLKPGGGLGKRLAKRLEIPEPESPKPPPALHSPWRMVAPGIGGTGVVTVNAILAAAAAMDGLHVATLDQTGLAQKGGAVVSHLTLAREPFEAPVCVNAGNADLLLGYDLLGAANAANLRCAVRGRTVAVLNTDLTPSAASLRRRFVLYGEEDRGAPFDAIAAHTLAQVCLDATRLSERHFGTHMLTNMILLGAAWQEGLVPLTLASVEEAIRLNGVEVESNLAAFWLGRTRPEREPEREAELTFEQRLAELRVYQNDGWAREYAGFVERVRARRPEIGAAVENALFGLMTYKDEYEVARLLTLEQFEAAIETEWQGVERIEFNLHPPLLRAWGLKRKIALGGWARPLFRALAAMKVLRGTAFDLFGRSGHRRRERGLIAWYRELVEQALELPVETARELAALPFGIRGYEAVKDRAIERARERARLLLESSGSGNLVGSRSPD
jgi:indolepyruvate ferredoxin oxidoreductase